MTVAIMKKTKNLKTRVGIFQVKSPGGKFPGGSLMGANFPGGSFPGTIFIDARKIKV